MSTPNDPSSPAEPVGNRPPSTEEIPVAAPAGATAAPRHPLPPHPGAVAPAPVPAASVGAPVGAPVGGVPVAGPQPTGPVGFMPGLPGTPPVPPPPAPAVAQPVAAQPGTSQPGASWPETLESDVEESDRSRGLRGRLGARDPQALIGIGLAALALVLVLLGLTLEFGTTSFWSIVPLWSTFATLCALLGVLAVAASSSAGHRVSSGAAWRVAAAGLVGLSVFWLLVVLPLADSDRGFLLTAAVGCLGGALWLGSRTSG